MVTITIAKIVKLLKNWKTDRDLKVKYNSLHLCDSFLLEILTVMMKTSLALVIQLFLTFIHGTDKARMNEAPSFFVSSDVKSMVGMPVFRMFLAINSCCI